jgi:hypothetical protein
VTLAPGEDPALSAPTRSGRVRPGRRLRRWLLGFALALPLLLVVVALVAVLWLVPSQEPSVKQVANLGPDDVERALRLARSHDPRRALPGVLRVLRLSQHEAELLLNQAAARVRPSRWQLALNSGRVHLRGSLRLPATPLGSWLNLELVARQGLGLPQLESVRLGRLPLPVGVVEWALERLAARHGLSPWSRTSALVVHRVRVSPQGLNVYYAWGPDAAAQVVATLLPGDERDRLRVYAAQLADLTADLAADLGASPASTSPATSTATSASSAPATPATRHKAAGVTRSLSQLLPPMFELARLRSERGHDPALENRAALLVLGMVANGVSLATLLPERRDELARHPIQLTLAGRHDFPQHFLVSATLAAENGGPMADMIGLYKELNDARSGSGFSFNDVAANRAGSRLGELAVGSPIKLQQRLAASLHEQDFMPDVSDLPEFMSAREFRLRYGAPGSPAYQRMMSDIEERLGATPLFR